MKKEILEKNITLCRSLEKKIKDNKLADEIMCKQLKGNSTKSQSDYLLVGEPR
jgi:hypothetical protein